MNPCSVLQCITLTGTANTQIHTCTAVAQLWLSFHGPHKLGVIPASPPSSKHTRTPHILPPRLHRCVPTGAPICCACCPAGALQNLAACPSTAPLVLEGGEVVAGVGRVLQGTLELHTRIMTALQGAVQEVRRVLGEGRMGRGNQEGRDVRACCGVGKVKGSEWGWVGSCSMRCDWHSCVGCVEALRGRR